MIRYAALCLLISCACAAAAPPVDLRGQLLCDVSAARPGQTVTLGVLLHVPVGWHIYWQNPGDSGLATRVKFTAPPGYDVGPLRFPVPERFEDAESNPGAVMFGYTGEVMLTAAVTVPKDAAVGSTAQISADATWLVCSNMCIPGKATLTVSLPIAADSAQAHRDLFEKWKARVPVAADDAASPLKSDAITAGAGGLVRVSLQWKQAPQDVQFFADLDPAVELHGTQVRQDGSVIEFTPVVLKGLQPAKAAMEAVIAYNDSSGQRRGVSLSIPYQGH